MLIPADPSESDASQALRAGICIKWKLPLRNYWAPSACSTGTIRTVIDGDLFATHRDEV